MNEQGFMVISKERGIYTQINSEKVATGSFYTEKATWLTSPVDKFLRFAFSEGAKIALDPYAGNGHLLQLIEQKYDIPSVGFDIKGFNGNFNDSLINIPIIDDAIIITNPPYLTNYSAKRKRVFYNVSKYFELGYEDLYQVALSCCLKSARFTVAIVPETFINSTFDKMHVVLCNTLTESPFNDTENPVCVICLDNKKTEQNFDLYIDNLFAINSLDLLNYKKSSTHKYRITFNDPNGNIGLKAVDGTKVGDKITFLNGDSFYYQREKIKQSSRLLTYINLHDLKPDEIQLFVTTANLMLEEIRVNTKDLIFSPFKGNNKDGTRRRRLDYKLARFIINESLENIFKTTQRMQHAQPNLL